MLRIIVAILFFGFTSTLGQDSQLIGPGEGTLSGRVLDQSGAVYSGAKVILSDSGIRETATDEGGNFIFTHLFPGTYLLNAEVEDQPSFILADAKEVDVPPDSTVSVDLKLRLPAPPTIGVRSASPINISKKTFSDRVSLQNWLDDGIEGQLVSVVSVQNGTSFFVSDGRVRGNRVRMIKVQGTLETGSLPLGNFLNRTFVGVHRLDNSSFLMLFR